MMNLLYTFGLENLYQHLYSIDSRWSQGRTAVKSVRINTLISAKFKMRARTFFFYRGSFPPLKAIVG